MYGKLVNINRLISRADVNIAIAAIILDDSTGTAIGASFDIGAVSGTGAAISAGDGTGAGVVGERHDSCIVGRGWR